jgi:hypothetical protein
MQAAFRAAGGFPLLVKLIDAAVVSLMSMRRSDLGNPSSLAFDRVPTKKASSALDDSSAHFHGSGGESGCRNDGGAVQSRLSAHRSLPGHGTSLESKASDDDEWCLGPRRIAPAVESLAVLARNNSENRYST